jgi:glycosidase
MVYYGTEAGMWGADDPDDRKPMVWPDIAFEPEQNHPYGLERKADSVGFNHRYYELFESLAQIRNSTKALQRGDLEVLPSSPRSLVFLRSIENEQVLVFINRGDTPEDIPIHRWETTRGKWSLLYSSTRKTPQINKEEISGQAITIAPISFSIYHRN